MIAVEQAIALDWEVVAPLPFGLDLNIAINAEPDSAEQASAILKGQSGGHVEADTRVRHMRQVACQRAPFRAG